MKHLVLVWMCFLPMDRRNNNKTTTTQQQQKYIIDNIFRKQKKKNMVESWSALCMKEEKTTASVCNDDGEKKIIPIKKEHEGSQLLTLDVTHWAHYLKPTTRQPARRSTKKK